MNPKPALDLCASEALAERGAAVAFDVVFEGRACRAFAVRFGGEAHAYLNRCGHMPMEMDYVEGQFFDSTGQWLMCATHGATYAPTSGKWLSGPCGHALIKIAVSEEAGRVHWHTSPQLQPPEW